MTSIFSRIKKGRIKKPLFLCLYSGPGTGKCFDPSTMVLMHSGKTRPISDIRVGDKVMGPDSKARTVLGRSVGIDQMYDVKLRKGDSFKCNSRHIIYGQTKKFKDFKISAKDLSDKSDSQIERFKLLRTGVNFKSNKTKLDPYFVGLWLGDGCISLKALRISNPDHEVKKFLKSYSKTLGCELIDDDGLNMRIVAYRRGESTKIHPFKSMLSENIINKEKRISNSYLINSRSKRLKMLAGIIDTDGHLTNKTFEVVTQYDGLSDDIIFLAKSLGFQATHRIKTVDGKGYHRIFISGETNKIPTKIKRKQAGKRLQVKSVLREGFKISKSKKGEYVGIHVDGDNLFMLSNFIIVHNTDFAASFPKPFFFDFEESSHNIDVERVDDVMTFMEVMDGLQEIHDVEVGTLDFKSIVFDTIDELERIMHVHIAEDNGKKTIDHIGWQKGFDYAVNLWADFISICRMIRDKHNVHILFLAHSAHKSKDDIEKEETYMRNTINLHKKSAAFFFGAVEMVLYAKKQVTFKKDSNGNTIAKDSTKRELCTSLSAHYDAKNRIQLPPVMDMPVKNGFAVIWAAYERAFNQTPDQAYMACTEAIKKVNDKVTRDQMTSYIEANKIDITILRTGLLRINEIIGEQQ